MTGIIEQELRRARWQRYRNEHGIGTTPRSPLGLAARAEPLGVRVAVLPADPYATSAVGLDPDTETLLRFMRSDTGGPPVRWGEPFVTSGAAGRAIRNGDNGDRWRRYIAVHRHGGVEAGLSDTSRVQDGQKAVALRSVVAAVWAALDLEVAVTERWAVEGPWELTVTIANTGGAVLSHLAEGWPEPYQDIDVPTCADDGVELRWELGTIIPADVAIDAGNRVENAFGTVRARHIARSGASIGKFDPRGGW